MTTFFDAFISYGRADSKAFATQLHARLVEAGLKVWFDQNDIPLGVDFQNQIDDGIEKAYNFLFIIAPHSVNSPYCRKEIELALKRNKRIIPLLHVEQINRDTWQQRFPKGTAEEWAAYKAKELHSSFPNMHPAIGKINWVYFREGIDDFEAAFTGLMNLLGRHHDYVEQHTQFLAQALEWERYQKQTSYLLIGEERKQAESWLKIHFKNEQSPCLPTDLHCEYITESIKNANNLMTQVFLSYADEDRATMEKIRNSLRRESITVWTNKTDIQTGEAFEDAINRGIEQADNLVFLLSPESVNSTYCQQELDVALSLNKRIIPVLVRQTDLDQVPTALRFLQYIDLTDNVKEDDYLLDESQLLKIVHQDAAYYNEHKVLLTKALKWKWQHENPSILLRGYNLRSAEAWLKVAKTRIQHPPTSLQEEFIEESLRQLPLESLDVFISYSRADSDFARKLNDSLQIQGKTTWFDQESIASGSDFQNEIYRGIKACDNFLFILSPRSVNSPYCADEVEYAASLNKRFVTVLHREVNSCDLHPELAKVQWIDFNHNERDFNANFNQLVRTLDTDRVHVHSHTKWLQRALEWKQRDKSADLLLRGSEFLIAQNWLQETEQQQKKPIATVLQKEFIEASQKAIVAAEEAETRRQAEMLRLQEERTKEAEARLAEQKKSARRLKLFLASVVGTLMVSTVLAVVAFVQYCKAVISEIKAISVSSEALLTSNQDFEALQESLKASQKLNKTANYLIFTSLQEKANIQNTIDILLENALCKVTERNRLEKHKGEVTNVSFSPDGKIIATASADRIVKLWDLDGKEIKTLEGHQGLVGRVRFNPTGNTIATASLDGTAKLWTREGKLIATLKQNEKKLDSVDGLSFSPDGQTVATADAGGNVKFWTLSGKLIKTFKGHEQPILNLSFSPDGNTLATASQDKTVKLWNRDGKLLRTLMGHRDWVWSVNFSPNGQKIATASRDETVKLWSIEGKEIRTLNAHKNSVTSVSFSPDGKQIATSGADNTVKIWSESGEELQTLSGHRDWVWNASFSPDGKMIATASKDGTTKLWQLKGKKHQIYQAHSDAIYGINFSPDGKEYATASKDKTVKIWKRSGELIKTIQWNDSDFLKNPDVWFTHVSFSPNKQIIATATSDGNVILWNRQGEKIKNFKGHEQTWIWQVSFSPDGRIFATAGFDGIVKLWTLDGNRLKTLEAHTTGKDKNGEGVNSVSFSPDGKIIASASWDKKAKLWTREGQLITTLQGHADGVHSISFSPDGKVIATASQDKTVKLWTPEGQLIRSIKGHDAGVFRVRFSPDGKAIATASLDKTVKLWSLDGKELKTYKGHDDSVWSLNFSPDGYTLASADNLGKLITWNLGLDSNQLLVEACHWVGDYLKNNPNVSESNRILCKGIGIQK